MSVLIVPLSQGKVALIDEEDWPLIAAYRWHAARNSHGSHWYARANTYRADGTPTTTTMHRVILGAPDHLDVDHIDGDGLRNVRSNLRLATTTQNKQNQAPIASNTSGYKGVTWRKDRSRWTAQIRVAGRLRYLGYFDDPCEAARAYDRAAREHFGEFARTNFPD